MFKNYRRGGEICNDNKFWTVKSVLIQAIKMLPRSGSQSITERSEVPS